MSLSLYQSQPAGAWVAPVQTAELDTLRRAIAQDPGNTDFLRAMRVFLESQMTSEERRAFAIHNQREELLKREERLALREKGQLCDDERRALQIERESVRDELEILRFREEAMFPADVREALHKERTARREREEALLPVDVRAAVHKERDARHEREEREASRKEREAFRKEREALLKRDERLVQSDNAQLPENDRRALQVERDVIRKELEYLREREEALLPAEEREALRKDRREVREAQLPAEERRELQAGRLFRFNMEQAQTNEQKDQIRADFAASRNEAAHEKHWLEAFLAGPLLDFFQLGTTVRVEQSLKTPHQLRLTEMESQPLLLEQHLEQHPKSE